MRGGTIGGGVRRSRLARDGRCCRRTPPRRDARAARVRLYGHALSRECPGRAACVPALPLVRDPLARARGGEARRGRGQPDVRRARSRLGASLGSSSGAQRWVGESGNSPAVAQTRASTATGATRANVSGAVEEPRTLRQQRPQHTVNLPAARAWPAPNATSSHRNSRAVTTISCRTFRARQSRHPLLRRKALAVGMRIFCDADWIKASGGIRRLPKGHRNAADRGLATGT